MNEFEDRLRQALIRHEPPAGFTERVLAKVTAERRPSRNQAWQWLAAAAALILLASSALYQNHEQQLRGQDAKQKLLVAMRIAGSKLQQAQHHVQETESLQVNE